MNISGSGPVVLRILLGAELRRLREIAGVTAQQASAEIGASESKISRMERGRNAFKQDDVAELLFLYGVSDETVREDLLSLARRANQPGWWHSYQDVLPGWFQPYVGLEAAAQRIRTFESHYIPPNLTLQVTPFAVGGHTALNGFSILRFPDPQMTDVIYVEQLTNALYLDKREEVDAYFLAMERLSIVSASPAESVDILGSIMDDF